LRQQDDFARVYTGRGGKSSPAKAFPGSKHGLPLWHDKLGRESTKPYIRETFMQRLVLSLVMALAVPLGISFWAGTAAAEPSHAIAMHGDPALPAGFTHLP
jgi:hypothetical protein